MIMLMTISIRGCRMQRICICTEKGI